MKPQTIVVTITGGLEETGKGAAFGYLLNELEADHIQATVTEVKSPHTVAVTAGALLSALENAVRCAERDGIPGIPGSAPKWTVAARAVIAKATGGA